MTRRHPKRNTKSKRFAMLPHSVLGTEAVISLPHSAFRLLVILAAQYNGRNNGGLGLGKNQAEVQGIARNTLYRGLATLEERGLIEQTYPASRVPPRPTMYALNWLAADDTDWSTATRTPAHTYKSWSCPGRAKPKRKRGSTHAKLKVVEN